MPDLIQELSSSGILNWFSFACLAVAVYYLGEIRKHLRGIHFMMQHDFSVRNGLDDETR